jgi:NhaP-type Na+/H+ or K+/H+ antiporter
MIMMDDEMEAETGPGTEQQVLRFLAFSALGEIFLLLGLLFIFLGAAAFLSDFLRIKGGGEIGVGVLLVLAAFVFLMRNKAPAIQIRANQKPPAPVRPPAMDSYR